MKIFTIGFTKKSAQSFFEKLKKSNVKRIIDVRLNNVSQLAGFAKKDDLRYFMSEIVGAEYIHVPELAPTAEILDDYKKHKGSWENYETKFVALMEARKIQETLDRKLFNDGCLLCSEDKPHHCHRRLVAEYLKKYWSDVEIIHLV